VVVTQYLLLLDINSKIIDIFSFSELSPDIDFNSSFSSSLSNKVNFILEINATKEHNTK
jgi:hypothetical protein